MPCISGNCSHMVFLFIFSEELKKQINDETTKLHNDSTSSKKCYKLIKKRKMPFMWKSMN